MSSAFPIGSRSSSFERMRLSAASIFSPRSEILVRA
jgi:hypothetical protein